ncbi:MAG: dihydroorotate dehydrogenase electron transfer subunit [Methanomicrobiales archaeon]|nr:dihydroorotate dehydrogenase electron transfer subunit [Methanomicrobiales archaeon]MDI6876860.1 dihydroorotate dehydrogenase electron transfer subunit [Methanomicrobiales archaeon]
MPDALPRAVTIRGIVKETPTIRSLFFEESFPFSPGQFVMVWVPGVDEIPMALSSAISISVQRVGDATAALFGLSEGGRIGIRGPFGNGFSVHGRTLAVAGGIGAAPLVPLAAEGKVETFLLGAKTWKEVPFTEALRRCTDLRIATDDGTLGHHGFVTDLLDAVRFREFDHVCVCGPEAMMRTVLKRLQDAGIADRGQFSLHRYMKCGVGVCGSCCIDPDGLRVCRDGPVFPGDRLLESEFGRYARDGSGRKVYI